MGVRVKEWDGGKGGVKAWWIFISHQNRRKAKRVGTGVEGRKTALLLAEKITAKMALDDFHLSDEPRQTLRQFTERWLDAYVDHNLRRTTAAKYREVMRVHWLPIFGAKALQDITRQDIRTAVQRFQAQGLQNSSIRWFLNVIQSCLAAAVEDGGLESNPAAKATKWVLRAKIPGARINVFTAAEIKQLLLRAQKKSPMTHAMVTTLSHTGLRISELMGLKVEDLDFARREIHVQRTWGNTSRGPQYYGILKSGKERIVDMSQRLKETLQAWIAMAPENDEGWLFPSRHGRPMVPNSFYATHWKPLFDALIPYRHPHVFRHTHATHLLWQGESPVYVKEQLGHSSIRITVDTYGHHITSRSKDAVDRLDDAVDNASIRKSGASKTSQGLWIIQGGAK